VFKYVTIVNQNGESSKSTKRKTTDHQQEKKKEYEKNRTRKSLPKYFNSDIVNILNPLIHDLHLCFLQPFLTTYLISRRFYCQPIRFGILY
jgi:hypothetical protein